VPAIVPAIVVPLLCILSSVASCRRARRRLATLLSSKLLSTSSIGHRSLARWYRAPLGTLATLTDSVIDKVIIEFVSGLSTSAKADSPRFQGRIRKRLIVLWQSDELWGHCWDIAKAWYKRCCPYRSEIGVLFSSLLNSGQGLAARPKSADSLVSFYCSALVGPRMAVRGHYNGGRFWTRS
jgi:hypothetical protein